MVTGPDFSFALIYLLPVVATAWWVDTTSAIIVALAASLAWSIAHYLSGEFGDLPLLPGTAPPGW